MEKSKSSRRADTKLRAFSHGGKRIGIRLSDSEWAAIDLVASQCDEKWTEWAQRVYQGQLDLNLDVLNITGLLRSTAMEALTLQAHIEERTEMNEQMDSDPAYSAIWHELGQCGDDDLTHALKGATKIIGNTDLVGFELTIGLSECGNVTYYLRNGVRDYPNLIISTPFKPDQWTAAHQRTYGADHE